MRDSIIKNIATTAINKTHIFCLCFNQQGTLLVGISLRTTGACMVKFGSGLEEIFQLDSFIVVMSDFARFFYGVVCSLRSQAPGKCMIVECSGT